MKSELRVAALHTEHAMQVLWRTARAICLSKELQGPLAGVVGKIVGQEKRQEGGGEFGRDTWVMYCQWIPAIMEEYSKA